MTQVPEADPPLPKRAPHASLAPDLVPGSAAPGNQASRPAARSPEQVRSMLTRYRSGLERGRAAAARDLPDDPDGRRRPTHPLTLRQAGPGRRPANSSAAASQALEPTMAPRARPTRSPSLKWMPP